MSVNVIASVKKLSKRLRIFMTVFQIVLTAMKNFVTVMKNVMHVEVVY